MTLTDVIQCSSCGIALKRNEAKYDTEHKRYQCCECTENFYKDITL